MACEPDERGERSPKESPRRPWAPWVVLAGLACALVLPVALMTARAVAIDEAEFFSATARVRQGLVPYRDFWEHHLPLQWLAMAPFIATPDPPGVADVVRMRRIQSLLWLPGAVAFLSILRRRGVGAPAAVAALALLSSAALFAAFAVEYRIDTPMSVLFLAGLALAEAGLERAGRGAALCALGAGALLAVSVLASQRVGPVAAAALVLYVLVRRDGRWGIRPVFLLAWAGAAAVAGAVVVLFHLLGGLSPLLLQTVSENAAYERLAASDGAARLLPVWPFVVAAQGRDAGTLLLAALSLLAAVTARRPFREPRAVTRLGLLALVQAGVLAGIRSPYPYQASLLVVLLALLAGLWLQDVSSRPGLSLAAPAAAGVAGLCALSSLAGTDFQGMKATAAFQQHVLTTVARLTRPGEAVLDGSGISWVRPGASPRWFTPRLVTSLTRAGLLGPVGAAALERSRPAAVVWDFRLEAYGEVVSGFTGFLVRNYLPLERAIWIPAPSGRIGQGERARWTVLRSGTYRVAAAAPLARHPWFEAPLSFPRIAAKGVDAYALDLARIPAASALTLSVDGAASPPGPLRLRTGQQVEAQNGGGEPLGVFLWPEAEPLTFRDPFPSVPLWPLPDIR